MHPSHMFSLLFFSPLCFHLFLTSLLLFISPLSSISYLFSLVMHALQCLCTNQTENHHLWHKFINLLPLLIKYTSSHCGRNSCRRERESERETEENEWRGRQNVGCEKELEVKQWITDSGKERQTVGDSATRIRGNGCVINKDRRRG